MVGSVHQGLVSEPAANPELKYDGSTGKVLQQWMT